MTWVTRRRALAASVVIAIAVSVGIAFLLAIALAVVDLYQAGHNLPELARPWIDSGSVRLSRADALFLTGSGAGGLFAGLGYYRVFTRRGSNPPHARRS
jgi:hypothetical protein